MPNNMIMETLELTADDNKITFTAHIGSRLTINPPGLPPGRYFEQLGFGVEEGHRRLFGPLDLIVSIQLSPNDAVFFSNGARWWDLVDASKTRRDE